MKNTNPLKDQRNRDFLKACSRVISESTGPLTAAQVALAAASGPAPEFYITFGHAFKVLGSMRLHGFDKSAKGNRAVYIDINNRVDSLMHRRGCSFPEALALVLASGNAPRFYLTPKTAVYLLSTLKNRNRKTSIPHHRHTSTLKTTKQSCKHQ